MRLSRSALVGSVVVSLALTGCGGGSDDAPKDEPTPSATPTLPSAKADSTTARRALVTPTDVGSQWVPQGAAKVNRVKGKKGEYCPGVPVPTERYDNRGEANRTFTLGTKTGADILSVELLTFGRDVEQKWRPSVDATYAKCRSWRAKEGNFVVLTPMQDPPAIDGADEVVGDIQRVFADKAHKQLQYVRQTAMARAGRVVTLVQLAFITRKTDPAGKDLDRMTRLLQTQVDKASGVFEE